jgi:hypothetical protein
MVELDGGHLHGSLDLTGIGKALARQRITAEEAPPALLQIEPARAFGNEDVLDAWMVYEPGARFQAIVTAQVVGDDEDIPRGIVRFDGLEELNVVLGVPRKGTSGDLLAITDT